MSDQQWAILIGAGTMALLRIIDFFFPRGRWYNWSGHSKNDKADSEVKDDGSDKS